MIFMYSAGFVLAAIFILGLCVAAKGVWLEGYDDKPGHCSCCGKDLRNMKYRHRCQDCGEWGDWE